MKPRFFNVFLAAAFAGGMSQGIQAADIFKANNTNDLATAGSWTTVAPTSADRAVWNNTVTAANTSNLGTTAAWQGIKIGDASGNPGGNVGLGINSTRTLTLGTAGIDLSQATVNLTISGAGNLRTASSASQSFTVPSGRTLNIDTTLSTQGGTTTITATGGGSINFSKALTNSVSPLNITTTGSGTTTTFTGGVSNITALSATTSGSVIVNGATVNSNTSSTYGSSSTNAKFELQSGTMNFNGGVGTSTTDGSLIKVSGGTFTASSVSLARTANPGQTSAPLTSGFVVTGGTAGITNNLTIGTSNSSATARVDGGDLTIGGSAIIGNTTNTRWSTLQVSNGTLSVTGASGIQLSTNTTTANSSQLLLTGGTTTTEAIRYGVATSTAASRGDVIINNGAVLYVGSGGVSVVSTNAYTSNFSVTGATVGAKASWTTSQPITLGGVATFRAADATNASFDIGLSGVLSGTGGLTKTGGGTLTLGAANSYTGSTVISAGTLALSAGGSIASSTIINNGNFNVSAVTGFTLASGQSISGSGSVTGAMSIAGTISPGNSPGTLSSGSLSWLDGGDYNWQVLDAAGSAGSGYDTVAVTGTLDLSALSAGGFNINLWTLSSTGPDVSGNASGFNNTSSYSWTLASTTDGIIGFDPSDFVIWTGANNGAAGFSNDLAGGSFSVTQSGNNLMLNFTAVPEPGAALLGGLGALALLRRRRF